MASAGDGIDIVLREGFVEARHAGTYSAPSFGDFIARSFLACTENDVALLLVDLASLSGFKPTLTQRYEIGTLSSTLGKGMDRVAIFGTAAQLEGGFSTTVAQNRGLNVRVFTDREEALRWLLGQA